MKSFNQMIISKIMKNRFRLILMIINFSIGIFLFSLIITLGVNIEKNNVHIMNDLTYLKHISIKEQEFNSILIENLHNHENIKKIQVELESHFVVTRIGDKSISNPVFVTQIDSNHDLIVNHLSGDYLVSSQDIMISIQFLQLESIDPNQIIGHIVILEDGTNQIERIVSGTFDSNIEDFSSPLVIMQHIDDNNTMSNLLIEVDSIHSIHFIEEYIKQFDLIPTSHLQTINDLKNANRLTTIGFVFVGILLLLTSTAILRTTLRVSVKAKYPFIAMLRSLGYTHKKVSLVVLVEILILTCASFIVGFILYAISLMYLPKVISTRFIPIEFVNLFSFRPSVVLLTVICSIFTLTTIAIQPIRMLRNCDVVGILKESEQ